jgi:hypothetical protein
MLRQVVWRVYASPFGCLKSDRRLLRGIMAHTMGILLTAAIPSRPLVLIVYMAYKAHRRILHGLSSNRRSLDRRLGHGRVLVWR